MSWTEKTKTARQHISQATATMQPKSVDKTMRTLVAAFLATVMFLFVWISSTLLISCGGGDDSSSESVTPKPPVVQPGAPSITVSLGEINVFGGAKIEQVDNSLLIGGEKVAWWTSTDSKVKTVYLTFNGKAFYFGSILSEKWTLTLFVENEAGKSANRDISITADAVFWTANLGEMQVDHEINLLNGITFANGLELAKMEIEQDGKRTEITDPQHFTPEYPGTCAIIFTLKQKNGSTAEYKVENLTIKAIEHQSIAINNLQPKEILPIVGKINVWDKKAYEHIEHLRIAESTFIRDMMWKYGAGKYSPEEYQQLMLRLNTGMIWEKPLGFDNYELIGEDYHDESEHAHNSWDILNTTIKHANFKVLEDFENAVDELYQKQPKNAINIFWTSTSIGTESKDTYNNTNYDYFKLKKYLNKDNFIRFYGWLDIRERNSLKKKIIQENLNLPDEYSLYWIPQSQANSENDANIDKHIFITIWTNKSWNADITNSNSGSDFPVWFHKDVLFSWRAFPYNTVRWNISGEDWYYTTSWTNFTNVAMTDLCFQMKADIKNVDELMTMIRATSLTDQIHLDGQTQDLHLINPDGYIKKYLMPTVPATISWSKTAALEKGYYHGVIFNIPGAEVSINGEWIPFNAKNKDAILAQNPMTLEWRINGTLLRKLGYKQGDTVTGQLIVTDDQWHGLNITQDISIQLTQ